MKAGYRPAEAEDRQFIVSGWSTSLRCSYAAGLVQMDDWADVMHRQIERALERQDVRTIVAYDLEATDHVADLFGFITVDTALERPLVYYVYVKGPQRRAGYARGLFGAAGVDPRGRFDYACKTGASSRLQHKVPLARWQPLLARFPKNTAPPKE